MAEEGKEIEGGMGGGQETDTTPTQMQATIGSESATTDLDIRSRAPSALYRDHE